jgi:hypothetical protein
MIYKTFDDNSEYVLSGHMLNRLHRWKQLTDQRTLSIEERQEFGKDLEAILFVNVFKLEVEEGMGTK